jgi:hypothetical protein
MRKILLGYIGKKGWENGQRPIINIDLAPRGDYPIGSTIHIDNDHVVKVEDIDIFTEPDILMLSRPFEGKVDALKPIIIYLKGEYI